MSLCSDEQLVALFRGEDDAAFAAIHERYRRRLLAYLRRTAPGCGCDLEDTLQEVFVNAYHALRRDERDMALRAWLYRIAHNRAIDELRRQATVDRDHRRGAPPPSDDPCEEAQRREDFQRLPDDIERLPPQQQSALLKRELEGLSYTDVACALDTTVPAVKSLLVRARAGLAQASARPPACA